MPLKNTFIYRNSLSLVLFILFAFSILGQVITGMEEHNQYLAEHGAAPLKLNEYLVSGHFIQATFENWESEFFQMALFVILTIFLRQQGSSESKKLDGEEEVDKEPKAKPGSPWPVRSGGWILAIYKHSLSIMLIVLFILSFVAHWYGSWKDYKTEEQLMGKVPDSFLMYLSDSKLWFESFQNWQSEFFSVFALVVLSIFLRQKGSPQSKPVDAPNKETGK